MPLDPYLGLPDPAKRVPDPAGQLGRARFLELNRRDPPGQPLDDRRTQADHFRGLPYLCIEQIARGLSGGTFRVTQKRPRRKLVPTAADARVYKALPTPHAQADDAEYVPAPDSHPLCELFERVNEIDTAADLITKWVVNEELHGEAVLWPVPDRTGKPAEIWVVPTAACQQIYSGLSPQYPCGGLRVWSWQWGLAGVYGSSGGFFTLDNRDILRPRRHHPLYPLTGYSPLTAAAAPLDVADAILGGWKKHMDHGWMVEAILAVSGGSQPELDRLKAVFDSRFAGSRSDRILITDGEGIKADTLTPPGAKDMDYTGGWEQIVRFVTAMWQVGPGVLGMSEADNYASLYAKLKQHLTLCLRPKAKRMGDFLTKHLARAHWPGDRLCVQLDLPELDDQDSLRAWAGLKLGNLYSYNEARALQNLKPVGDGDVPADVYVARLTGEQQQRQQAAAVAAGLLPDPAKPPESPGGPPRPDNPDGEGSLPPRGAVRKSLRKILKSLK